MMKVSQQLLRDLKDSRRVKSINLIIQLCLKNLNLAIKLLFKVGERVWITKYKIILSKDYTKKWSKEIFVIDSVLKTDLQTYRIIDLNEEKILGSSYEKKLLLNKLQISYHPEPYTRIKDKVKVVLDLTSYASKTS